MGHALLDPLALPAPSESNAGPIGPNADHSRFSLRNACLLLWSTIMPLVFGFVLSPSTVGSGRQKLLITGGGPISSEVQGFIRVLLATPLVQGYALPHRDHVT